VHLLKVDKFEFVHRLLVGRHRSLLHGVLGGSQTASGVLAPSGRALELILTRAARLLMDVELNGIGGTSLTMNLFEISGRTSLHITISSS